MRPPINGYKRKVSIDLIERTNKHVKINRTRMKDGRHIGVCVAAVLDYLGIPIESYGYTSEKGNRKRYLTVLRENGFKLTFDHRLNGLSLAQALKRFNKLGYKGGDRIIILTHNKRSAHLLLVNSSGYRIIDTAPRCRQKVEEMVHIKLHTNESQQVRAEGLGQTAHRNGT
jgi:hypothetical protein